MLDSVKVNGSNEERYKLEDLLGDIRRVLGPSKGLDSDDVDVDQLIDLMRKYKSDPADWERYALGCEEMNYTRNLVDEGNGKANVLVLVWTPHRGSPVHDHGNAHCVMKILKGNIIEERFETPEANGEETKPLVHKSKHEHKTNEVAYMSDELGLHRVSNPSSDYAVSLHCYTPPNVAKWGCNTFNIMTGESTHIAKCENYSAYGQRLPDKK
ncbi:RmlC-like cupin domain-containing protein [Biscogniauxia marginata]|nr:RmlC-like cupin domain-containing protein [Biscogniauxia marginata]